MQCNPLYSRLHCLQGKVKATDLLLLLLITTLIFEKLQEGIFYETVCSFSPIKFGDFHQVILSLG